MEEQVAKLRDYMDASGNTVAVTGAGVSYMYGMRRFKEIAGRNALSRKLSAKYIKSHPDEIYALWKDAFLDATFVKGPSPVHCQMAELEKRGLLHGIVTQNLDYLHEMAGSTHVVAFMGSFADNVCMDCGAYFHDINVWNQGEMPRCPQCGGYLIPMYFSRFGRGDKAFGSDVPDRMNEAQEMIAQAELLLIIGTTGFHSDEYLARLRKSTKMVQINPGSTMFDSMADLNIRVDAQTVFDEILAEK